MESSELNLGELRRLQLKLSIFLNNEFILSDQMSTISYTNIQSHINNLITTNRLKESLLLREILLISAQDNQAMRDQIDRMISEVFISSIAVNSKILIAIYTIIMEEMAVTRIDFAISYSLLLKELVSKAEHQTRVQIDIQAVETGVSVDTLKQKVEDVELNYKRLTIQDQQLSSHDVILHLASIGMRPKTPKMEV